MTDILRFQRAVQGLYPCSLKESKVALQSSTSENYSPVHPLDWWHVPSISTAKLTPGGRYLVSTNTTATTICCWDLKSEIHDASPRSQREPRYPTKTLLSFWTTGDIEEVIRILTQYSVDEPNCVVVAAWLREANGKVQLYYAI